MRILGVPRLLGRYCSYLLPKQAGGTTQILIFETLRMIGRPALYVLIVFPVCFILTHTNISFPTTALDGNPLEPQLVSRPLKRSHPDFNATQPLPEAQQVSVTSDRDNIDFPSFSQPGTSCLHALHYWVIHLP